MNEAHKKLLKENFEKAVEEYKKALFSMWDIDHEVSYWIGDDVGGTLYLDGQDLHVGLDDMILCVDKDISISEYREWFEYCMSAAEFHLSRPNLKSWIAGCPRTSQETFDRLHKMMQDIKDLCELEENKLENK